MSMRTCCSQKRNTSGVEDKLTIAILPGEIKGTVWGKKRCIQLTWHCFLVKVTKDMGSRSPGYPAVFLSLTDPDIRSVIRSSLGKTWSGPSSDVIARHQQTFFKFNYLRNETNGTFSPKDLQISGISTASLTQRNTKKQKKKFFSRTSAERATVVDRNVRRYRNNPETIGSEFF